MFKPICTIIRPYQARKTELARETLRQLRRGPCVTPRAKSFGVREPAFDRSHKRGA